jgi:hypothetical protein
VARVHFGSLRPFVGFATRGQCWQSVLRARCCVLHRRRAERARARRLVLGRGLGLASPRERPDESVLQISIYHNPDENQATEDDWALMLRSLHKERKLGISRFRELEVDADAVSTLEDVFREGGVALRRTPPP